MTTTELYEFFFPPFSVAPPVSVYGPFFGSLIGGIRNDLTVNYACSYVAEFTLSPVSDITALTFEFTVRDRFQGNVIVQKSSGSGIAISSGPLAIWVLTIPAANLFVDSAVYHYDMQVTNAGSEAVTHYGLFTVLPSYLNN